MDLFAFVTSAPTVEQGAKSKTHIVNDNGDCLCGRQLWGLPSIPIDREWLEQPDYYNEVCKTCKKIALAELKNS